MKQMSLIRRGYAVICSCLMKRKDGNAWLAFCSEDKWPVLVLLDESFGRRFFIFYPPIRPQVFSRNHSRRSTMLLCRSGTV